MDPDPSSSSLGSFFISGFLSSSVATDEETEDEVVSMGSPLHPSPDGFSFFIWERDFSTKTVKNLNVQTKKKIRILKSNPFRHYFRALLEILPLVSPLSLFQVDLYPSSPCPRLGCRPLHLPPPPLPASSPPS